MVQYVDLLSDTICSPITAPGHSGVSVIRVSGDKAKSLTLNLIKSLPSTLESHRAYFGTLKDTLPIFGFVSDQLSHDFRVVTGIEM